SGSETDTQARQIFANFGANLGRVLRDVIAPFHPDIVVLGGGISRSAPLFLPTTEREVQGLGFRIATSTLLDKAPLVGAAHFWREESS
ncbi:MAG TPA: ROK family protein, partial [Myxococcaceae bacterium]|nr:ROK family protein [Myxococcaceae bacterium]